MWKPRFAQAHACFRHQREEANKVGQFSQKQFIEMMAAILYFQLKDFDLSSTFLCLQIMALVDKWINKPRDKILHHLCSLTYKQAKRLCNFHENRSSLFLLTERLSINPLEVQNYLYLCNCIYVFILLYLYLRLFLLNT